MRSRHRHTVTLGSTDTPVGPRAAPHLRVVGTADPVRASARSRILDQLTRHISLARKLGLEPLTVDERAEAMLDAACSGWRAHNRCVDDRGRLLDAPHQACLRAQYHHDVLLLEHGLLTHERTANER